MDHRGQGALEFMVLAGFMLFIFTAFFFVISQRNATAVQQGRYGEMVVVADIINQEVTNAYRVQDGYTRIFEIPATINGEQYNITRYGTSEMLIQTANEEYLLFLQANVTVRGSGGAETFLMTPGRYIISKNQGNITINSAGTEIDTCSFTNSGGYPVSCFTSNGDHCTTSVGVYTCNIPVTGIKDQTITWTSSCAPTPQTTIFDGNYKTINFACLFITETFTCFFDGSPGPQTCSSSKGVSCTGKPKCDLDQSGVFGESVTFTSTCGGAQTVQLDDISTNNNFHFDCNNPIQENVTCRFLENPGNTLVTHTCLVQGKPQINCSVTPGPGSAHNECTVAVSLPPSTGMEWYSDNCRGGVSTQVSSENKAIPFFCSTSP